MNVDSERIIFCIETDSGQLEVEAVSSFQFNGNSYIAAVPTNQDAADGQNIDILLLRYEESADDSISVFPLDDQEHEEVAAYFEQNLIGQ